MKKIIWLLIFCMLLTPILAACKDDGGAEPPTETVAPEVEEPPEILKTLPDVDFNNEKFIYMCYEGEDLVNYDENNTSSPISADQFRRTQWVNDRFNVMIEMDYVGGGYNSWDAMLLNHQANGENFNAALMHPAEGRAATLTGGYCADLLTVNTLNFNGEWYNQDMVANTLTNGKLLGMRSDFTVAASGIVALVYNETLYAQLGGELDLYQTVMDGDWTLEVFIDELKNLNATGYDSSNNTHGSYALGVNYLSHRVPMLWGAGVETTKLGSGNEWTLVWNEKSNKEKINAVLDYIHDLEENVTFFNNKTDNGSGGWRPNWYIELPGSEMLKLWNNGKFAFMVWDVGFLYQYLRDAEFEIGYAPFPKLNTQQADYVATDTIGGTMMSSRLSQEDLDRNGAILEGLARYSYIYTRPLFFEAIVGGRLSENVEDYTMLTLIYDSRYYRPDFAVAGKAYEDVVSGDPLRETCEQYIESKALDYLAIIDQVNKMQ